MTLDTTNTNKLYCAYVVDNEGFVVNMKVFDVSEEVDDSVVKTFIPQGLFKAKWNGIAWIEGETAEEKEERESANLIESLKPSLEEIADAELEIKMLTMLTDLGVIQ